MDYDRTAFAGKVALVTGGASGIGLALGEELLECGADAVVLADYSQDNLNREVTRLNEQYPGKVKGVLANVTLEDDVKRMIGEAAAFGGGRLDLLINCAGAALVGKFTDALDGLSPDNPVLKQTATSENWAKGFALNFYGALYGCRHALPVMIAQGGGQIVNIISGIAFTPMAYQCMYSATKAALNALTLSLRAEYARYGIKFNSATPGTTATAIFSETGGPPSGAQSPHQSAQRVLNGVARNDRLILGDDSDLDGAEHCFIPHTYGKIMDKIYLDFAHARKRGDIIYTPTLDFADVMDSVTIEQQAALNDLHALTAADLHDKDATLTRVRAYLRVHAADQVPAAYYEGKTAAVTGAASGIGLALALELLRCGAKKVALADHDRDKLNAQVARLLALYPGKVAGIPVDVSDEAQVQAMVAAASEFFGGPFDLMINCAGIGQLGLFGEVPDRAAITERSGMAVEAPERWAQVFAVNFYGPLYGCRAALKVMQRQGYGQIVNIISGTAFAGMPYQSIYASSKAALNALTLVLRYEYWDEGIRFNSATPGTTATAIFAGGDIPKGAQSPETSAKNILIGATRNERLILGDETDALGAIFWGNARMARHYDQLFEGFARARWEGQPINYGN